MWKTPPYKRLALLCSTIFIIVVLLIIWTDPSPHTHGTIKIYDRNGHLLYEESQHITSSQPVAFEEIPQTLIDSIITTEDKRFWHHFGIDILAIARAVYQNTQQRQIISGASTIPQQLARFTVISPQEPAETTILRKIRESLMAIRISMTIPREEILTRYVNSMHLGRGAYGAGAASTLYFQKSISDLSLSESALLAGMIANPAAYDPISHPETSRVRRDDILLAMKNSGYISEESYKRAIEDSLPREVSYQPIQSPHGVQYVLQEARKLPIDTRGGIHIYTTLDRDYDTLSSSIAARHIQFLSEKHDISTAAVVIIRNDTGEIIAMMGSIDYADLKNGGQNNMATALRQPGSAMKPVTYAAALESGRATAATMIIDQPTVYPTSSGEGYQPRNYDGRFRGPVLLREALASSYNMPAVELLHRIGIQAFLDLSKNMGITTLYKPDYDLALTLGGGEVTLLELTNLYATFARDGAYIPSHVISSISTDEGKTLHTHMTPVATQVLSPQASWIITDILSDNKARIPTFGEKNNLVTSKPTAVKTGTTTDWHDNWTIGYTKDFTVGVWVGNADNSPMRDITGETGAAPIWNDVIEKLIQFESYTPFTMPDHITEQEICAEDGLLPTQTCTRRLTEYFISGTEPTQLSSALNSNHVSTNDIQIINPKQQSVYKIDNAIDNTLLLEVTNHPSINSVSWTIDGSALDHYTCLPQSVTSCRWDITKGDHIIGADITLSDGTTQNLPQIQFSVIP